jgi:hypothetical protein
MNDEKSAKHDPLSFERHLFDFKSSDGTKYKVGCYYYLNNQYLNPVYYLLVVDEAGYIATRADVEAFEIPGSVCFALHLLVLIPSFFLVSAVPVSNTRNYSYSF